MTSNYLRFIITSTFLFSILFCKAQSWKTISGGNAFDGKYNAAAVVGKGGEFPYNSPRLVINLFNEERLNFYVAEAGYFGCGNNTVYFIFDENSNVIYKSFSVSTNNENDLLFIREVINLKTGSKIDFVEFFNLMKESSRLDLRVTSDCIDNYDYTFSLSGSSKAIDFVTAEYFEKVKKEREIQAELDRQREALRKKRMEEEAKERVAKEIEKEKAAKRRKEKEKLEEERIRKLDSIREVNKIYMLDSFRIITNELSSFLKEDKKNIGRITYSESNTSISSNRINSKYNEIKNCNNLGELTTFLRNEVNPQDRQEIVQMITYSNFSLFMETIKNEVNLGIDRKTKQAYFECIKEIIFAFDWPSVRKNIYMDKVDKILERV